MAKKNPHLGSTLESLLREDGTYEDAKTPAIKAILADTLERTSALRTAEFFTSRGAKADIEAVRRLLRRDGGQLPEPEDRLP